MSKQVVSRETAPHCGFSVNSVLFHVERNYSASKFEYPVISRETHMWMAQVLLFHVDRPVIATCNPSPAPLETSTWSLALMFHVERMLKRLRIKTQKDGPICIDRSTWNGLEAEFNSFERKARKGGS